MDTLTELCQLADDLTELGDDATATLVRQAIDRFSAGSSRPARSFWSERWKSGATMKRAAPIAVFSNTCVNSLVIVRGSP